MLLNYYILHVFFSSRFLYLQALTCKLLVTTYVINRGSYMSARVLLIFNIKQVGGKEIKCKACRAFYLFFAMSLMNSIIQEHYC